MPTCVGFGTGRAEIIARSFSWKLASCASLLARAFAYLSRPASCLRITGTGISACFPSTTPFGLALGPDLPRADEPSPGILGLSVCRILTCISLLTPAFSLPCAPALLSVRLPRACNAPLPFLRIRSFGIMLSPGTFSARLAPVHFRRRVTRLVSCYALFEGWLLLSQPPSCLCIPTSFST